MKKKRYILNFIQRNSIQLFLVFLLSVFFEINKIGLQIKNKVLILSTLDFSWKTDLTERFLHGYIAGRDFIFTYGPLYQLLHSLPSILFKIPSVSSLLYSELILVIAIFLMLSIMVLLLFPKNKSAFIIFYILYIIGVLSFDINNLTRLLLPLFYAAMVGCLYSKRKRKYLPLWSFLPTFFGLYSYDIFVYCVLFHIAYLFYVLYFNRKNDDIRMLAVSCFLIGVFHIVASFLLSGGFDYITYSFDTIVQYGNLMSIPWTFSMNYLLIFPVVSFVLTIYLSKNKSFVNRDILMALLISSLVQFGSSLTRSDESHIIMGIYPSIIAISFILFYLYDKNKKYVFIFMLILFVLPNRFVLGDVSVRNFKYFYWALRDKYTFNTLYKLPESYYFGKEEMNDIGNLVKNNLNQVWVYPYDNFLLNINGSTYNSFVLQSYGYSTSISEKRTVDLLDSQPPKFILLGIDDLSAYRIDGMPNFTRNPLIAKWMITHYDVEKKYKKYIVLKYKKNNNCTLSGQKCYVYNIDIKNILSRQNASLLFFKKPLYSISFNKYKAIRVPLFNNQTIFFVDGFNDIEQINKLFSECFAFNNYVSKIKETFSIYSNVTGNDIKLADGVKGLLSCY